MRRGKTRTLALTDAQRHADTGGPLKPHELVARFAVAANCAEPMAAARAELEQLKSNIAEVDEALRYISGVGGNARQVFYRSPNLTLLKVCFPAGRRTPRHDPRYASRDAARRGIRKPFRYTRSIGHSTKASHVLHPRRPRRRRRSTM